jgi:hypothetical protein
MAGGLLVVGKPVSGDSITNGAVWPRIPECGPALWRRVDKAPGFGAVVNSLGFRPQPRSPPCYVKITQTARHHLRRLPEYPIGNDPLVWRWCEVPRDDVETDPAPSNEQQQLRYGRSLHLMPSLAR